MLALQKERQSVRREDDLDRVRNLERQFAQVDAEIDQRVYALYGLTEEEIRIVEAGFGLFSALRTSPRFYLMQLSHPGEHPGDDDASH